jgi:hypothetical protein
VNAVQRVKALWAKTPYTAPQMAVTSSRPSPVSARGISESASPVSTSTTPTPPKASSTPPSWRELNRSCRAVRESHDDPNYVIVNLEFASREQAQKFLDLPEMRQAWKGFLGVDFETLSGGSHLRSRLGAEQFQARILDEIERVDY